MNARKSDTSETAHDALALSRSTYQAAAAAYAADPSAANRSAVLKAREELTLREATADGLTLAAKAEERRLQIESIEQRLASHDEEREEALRRIAAVPVLFDEFAQCVERLREAWNALHAADSHAHKAESRFHVMRHATDTPMRHIRLTPLVEGLVVDVFRGFEINLHDRPDFMRSRDPSAEVKRACEFAYRQTSELACRRHAALVEALQGALAEKPSL